MGEFLTKQKHLVQHCYPRTGKDEGRIWVGSLSEVPSAWFLLTGSYKYDLEVPPACANFFYSFNFAKIAIELHIHSAKWILSRSGLAR